MAKKRTKAERAAAAKASWERRRKGLPPLTKQRGKKGKGRHKPADREAALMERPVPVAQQAVLDAEGFVEGFKVIYQSPPQIVYAVKEGDEVFVCFAHDGSLNRNKMSESGARKLLRDLSAILI